MADNDRRTALVSEAASWALYASFSGLYFGLRSPILGPSTRSWAPAPRLVCSGYASYVGVGTALASRDQLFGRDV